MVGNIEQYVLMHARLSTGGIHTRQINALLCYMLSVMLTYAA
jgi:hypothetical protein